MAGTPKLSSASKSAKRVRRVKTFSGCWTCRNRGVKCDEIHPVCKRCDIGGHVCKGYGILLIWEDERETSLRCRRIIPRTKYSAVASLSEAEIDLAIETVDATHPRWECISGPFSVFPQSAPEIHTICFSGNSPFADAMSDSANDGCTRDYDDVSGVEDNCSFSTEAESSLDEAVTKFWQTPLTDTQRQVALTDTGSCSYAVRQISVFWPPSFLSGTEESGLLEFWISHLSNVFLPTERADNPFRSIYIPMILSAAAEYHNQVPGHQALLHTVCAMSAFGRAQMGSTEEHEKYTLLGVTHQHEALGQLARSIAGDCGPSSKDAILASIITLSSIDAIVGQFSTWRLHVRGGREWLDALHKKGWWHSSRSSALFSLFLCIEAVALSGDRVNTKQRRCPGQNYSQNSIFGLSETCIASQNDVCSMLGITRPILEIMVEINHLASQSGSASVEDLEALELKILFNNPMPLQSHELANSAEEIVLKHHASSYYYACWIHYHRCLRHTLPRSLQHLVAKGVQHLDAIVAFEQNRNVSGMLWPTFIIGCEAEGPEMRHRVMEYFKKGKVRGIGNIVSSANVVRELWRRRDEKGPDHDICWQDVGQDLGLDILLI